MVFNKKSRVAALILYQQTQKIMEPHSNGTDPQRQINKDIWARAARWYMRTPVLKHINPAGIIGLILAGLMVLIFPPGHCTCEDQIDDPKLNKLALAGDTNVRNYQKQLDDIYICAAKRAELLKKLELQKKKQQDSLKLKKSTPKT
ncbi:hypothetical protein SAMN05216464_11136 [Mucilaginibacter pineti]|uniref:Uncharacterized protein n=2 Tax=Mucilaginibacter pineti TaxID=1391627 RepID=A0A1G7H2Z0_9SPHI|nr:hypothetical protein SAMN05216464_11136 [Mucilaginibacter pineti]